MEQGRQHDHPRQRRASSDNRRNLLFGRSEGLDQHLIGARSTLIDSVIQGLLVVATVGVPASMARSFGATGWQPVYGVHLALGIAALLLFAFRGRLSDPLKAALLMALFWAVGLAGLLSFGLAGTGIWWLVFSSLLASVMYSIRTGLWVMGLALATLLAVGTAFNQGLLQMAFEPARYLNSRGAWISAALGATLMPLIVFRAVAALNAQTMELLKKAAEQREQIRELATHDELTGVPTFTLALDRLEQALRAIPRSSRNVAVLFIDLDGFKAINDTLGHEAGDTVLTAVARRLRLNLRVEDTVARIGGDEFLAILLGVDGPDDAIAVAAKLQRVLSEPVDYRDQPVSVACSVGAAFARDNHRSAEELIRAADAAMYEAKRAGNNQIRLAPSPRAVVPAQIDS